MNGVVTFRLLARELLFNVDSVRKNAIRPWSSFHRLVRLVSFTSQVAFPLRQAWRCELVANGLANGEPSRLVPKAAESPFAVLAIALLCFLIANLARDRHA